MKLILSIIIYFKNLFSCDVMYKLGKIDGKYFIYITDNYKNIASVYMLQILFFYIPILVLSDMFHTYSDEEKRFVFYHEIAHYRLKHYLLHVGLFNTPLLKEMEYNADEYAMNIVGKNIALKALNRTRNILIDLGENLDEINDRITTLELKDEYICG